MTTTNMAKTPFYTRIALISGALLFATSAHAFNLFGSKQDEAPLREGYTCCNLHYEGDWISDANWGSQAFIPAGSPIKMTGYGRYRLHVEINGKKMRIGQDYGREQETLEKFAEKLIVSEDVNAKIVQFPAQIREAILSGKVMTGMSKEQALIAVGYPETDQTVSLNAPIWNYWVSSFAPYHLHWDKNGRIKTIITDPNTQAMMVFGADD